MKTYEQYRFKLTGIVQGVGFRPFVYRLASEMGLAGYVLNNTAGVEICARGEKADLLQFAGRLQAEAPPQAQIDSLIREEAEGISFEDRFEIRNSEVVTGELTGISPDLPLCRACLKELFDPSNRRYYYPYINCTHCGPRYTIIKGVPYDRPQTTMAPFKMCADCQAEYDEPLNRRFHAQPNACHKCGPHYILLDNKGEILARPRQAGDYHTFFRMLGKLLGEGKVLALKGIGGYHLVCNALDREAVLLLRRRKFREDKPFALMCCDASQAGLYTQIEARALRLLQSAARPIVLLPRRPGNPGPVDAVAPGNKHLGIMLPYAPVHFLLLAQIDFPLVMTSANISSEPISFRDDEARDRLVGLCDYFAVGEREILTRCDDSVTRVFRGKAYTLRRARGLVPDTLKLAERMTHPVLALGGDEKNSVCLANSFKACLSQHIGDLKNPSAFDAFKEAVCHLQTLLGIRAECLAYDLHPGYLSSRFALNPPRELAFLKEIKSIGIQHHQAHIASCMAENGNRSPLIGIALDGTGFGPDGTIWGGEIFSVRNFYFTRSFSFQPFFLPGGDLAVKKCWRIAASCLYSLYGKEWPAYWPAGWDGISPAEKEVVTYQLMEGKSPLTSSCGRLFDAVSALSTGRFHVNYSGQAAIELEEAWVSGDLEGYPFAVSVPKSDGVRRILWQPVIKAILDDCRVKVSPGRISYRFHRGLVDILIRICHSLRQEGRFETVALSGGCFMNRILLETLSTELVAAGFTVLTHSRVPCNDGGLSLGQAALANSWLRRSECASPFR